jgi:hypothetical protein
MSQEKTTTPETKNNYRFTAHHLFLFTKVLAKAGITQAGTGYTAKQLEKIGKDKTYAQQQSQKMIELVIGSIGDIEPEFNAFMEAVTGKQDVANMDFEEFDQITEDVFGSEKFAGFFKSAIKLSLRMLVADAKEEEEAQ